jgi:glutathione S-transferase
VLELSQDEAATGSVRALRSLEEKQLGIISHYLAFLRFEQHRREFATFNRNGQVPVLVRDGAIITKSTAIND